MAITVDKFTGQPVLQKEITLP